MKELHFDADDGVWRVAFAFDENRSVVLLPVGDKSGVNEKRFCTPLIAKADMRFDSLRVSVLIKPFWRSTSGYF